MPDPSLDATIERLQAVIAAAVEIVNLIETGHANSGHAKRSAVCLRKALNDLGPDAVDRLQAYIERPPLPPRYRGEFIQLRQPFTSGVSRA